MSRPGGRVEAGRDGPRLTGAGGKFAPAGPPQGSGADWIPGETLIALVVMMLEDVRDGTAKIPTRAARWIMWCVVITRGVFMSNPPTKPQRWVFPVTFDVEQSEVIQTAPSLPSVRPPLGLP